MQIHNAAKRKKRNAKGLLLAILLTILHLVCYGVISLHLFAPGAYYLAYWKSMPEDAFYNSIRWALLFMSFDLSLSYINYRSNNDITSKRIVQLLDLVISLPLPFISPVDRTLTIIGYILQGIRYADAYEIREGMLSLAVYLPFLCERLIIAALIIKKLDKSIYESVMLKR